MALPGHEKKCPKPLVLEGREQLKSEEFASDVGVEKVPAKIVEAREKAKDLLKKHKIQNLKSK
jgi:hypothetical protein